MFQTRPDFQTTIAATSLRRRRTAGRLRGRWQPFSRATWSCMRRGCSDASWSTTTRLLQSLQRRTVPSDKRCRRRRSRGLVPIFSVSTADLACALRILDAPNAKWTLDVCLNQSGPWPIYISQVQPWLVSGAGRWPDVDWERGDQGIAGAAVHCRTRCTPARLWCFQEAVSGTIETPFRRPARASSATCCFFTTFPGVAGELVKPQNWARIFGIPELHEEGLPQER